MRPAAGRAWRRFLCSSGLMLLPATPVELQALEADELRSAFLRQIERPRVPAAVEVLAPSRRDGLRSERFTFASDAQTRLEAVLLAPEADAGRRACVVLLHATGGGNETIIDLATTFARRGLVAVALSARGYRSDLGPEGGRDAYMDSLVKAAGGGGAQPFLFDPAWDVMRLIDVLVARPDVDPARLGVLGRSKGGMEAVMVAAADVRVRAVVPCIGVQSFRHALERDAWRARARALQPAVDQAAALSGAKVDAAFMRTFFERVAPGLTGRFDMPAMLPLIAPRALLVINGETDARNPIEGVEACVAAARAAYDRAGAAKQFEYLLQPGVGHSVTPAAQARAVDWLVAQLAR